MGKKRGPVFWIGCGCLALLVGCSGIGAAGFFGVTTLLKSSTPYQESIKRVNASDAATAALGSPIVAGWMVTGSVSENAGGSGTADLSIPLHGPNGKGGLSVHASRVGGKWEYDRMTLTVYTDPPRDIDLLSDSGAGSDDDQVEHL